jgi:multiple sugar transport system permease protein
MPQSSVRLVKLVLLAFLVVWLIFTLFPFYFQVITSLKPVEEINRMVPTFWPETMKPDNYIGIFADPGSLKSIVDSLIVALSNTALSLLLGTIAGYALARFLRGPLGENLSFWILSNRMFPPVAILIPMFFLFDATPWGTDSYFSLIVLYLVFNLPLATWLMMVFFRDAPRELEEAAYLDGYPPLRAFFKVTLPLVFPGMISVAMLCFIFAWNEYLFANLLTGTTVKTFPVHIPSFTQGSQTLWNLVMAFSLVAMLPPVVLFIILRRYMVRGLSLGVVKG